MSQLASADDNSTGAAPPAAPVATEVAPSNRNMLIAEANYVSHAPAAAPVATVVAPSNRNMSNAEANYVSHGNDKRKLIVMTIGLETEIDADSSPWNSIPRREIKPRKKDFQDEVKRRGTTSLPPPRPNNWDVNQCITWLKENPLSGDDDLLFLRQESERVCQALRRAETETAMNNELTRTGQWRGPTPIIRLAHCVVHDEVKPHYIRRNQAMTRRQLDDRNSADRPLTAYEIIANKWNDDSFNPSSSILEVHPDFAHPIDITHAAVANLADATASKVEDLLTQIRTSLIRVVSDWEKSGQGEGGVQDLDQLVDDVEAGQHHVPAALYDVNDVEFGSLQNRSRPALSRRHNFLRGKPSYLLYFWELMDRHQLLQTTMQRLDTTNSAGDANSVRSLRTSGSKRTRQSDDDVVALESVSSALFSVAREQQQDRKSRDHALAVNSKEKVRAHINSLRDSMRDYRRYQAEAQFKGQHDLVGFYNGELDGMKEDIHQLEDELNNPHGDTEANGTQQQILLSIIERIY